MRTYSQSLSQSYIWPYSKVVNRGGSGNPFEHDPKRSGEVVFSIFMSFPVYHLPCNILKACYRNRRPHFDMTAVRNSLYAKHGFSSVPLIIVISVPLITTVYGVVRE